MSAVIERSERVDQNSLKQAEIKQHEARAESPKRGPSIVEIVTGGCFGLISGKGRAAGKEASDRV